MPGSHLRYGRFSKPGQIYLVTSVIQDRQPVFIDFHLGRLVVDELRRAQEQELVHSLAWVVMPDHLHWLFQLKKGTLSGLIQQVKARSAIAINKARRRNGRLWQADFHDKTIRRDKELIKVARYIIANPLRANLVQYIGDYPLWDAVWLESTPDASTHYDWLT
ncbi:REP-associated tyrosine transposase [Pseudomonas veronii]|uniref:REP-associated tyrosine transposase n=1 Tax=Pseudomonas veronii TaxID=76761 RepID=UPI000625D7AB|nr:transposase [Pseudomonas veronii]